MHNVFVTQAHDLELAGLAMGDFGAAQEGVQTVSLGWQLLLKRGVYLNVSYVLGSIARPNFTL